MGLLVDDIHANIFSSLVISMSGHGSLDLHFPSRTCFQLLNSVKSNVIEHLYSFSVMYSQ